MGEIMRVKVDVDLCIGAGQCVRAAAKVFDQDDETGLVVLLDENPPESLRDAVKNAERLCPARAIVVEE
jgi:ferredoxin